MILLNILEKAMSKISPMQAAALGLIPSPSPAKSKAAKPTATKVVVTKAKVAKPAVSKPAVTKPVISKPVIVKPTVSKPAVKAAPATKAVVKTMAKAKARTALKQAPRISNSANKNQSDKKNDRQQMTQKNNHKKDDKKIRPEKIKMERDSFTMPKDEYAQLTLLKARLTAMGKPAKKSELLRAGIKLLAAMSDNTLKTTMAKIPVIKTGRPNK